MVRRYRTNKRKRAQRIVKDLKIRMDYLNLTLDKLKEQYRCDKSFLMSFKGNKNYHFLKASLRNHYRKQLSLLTSLINIYLYKLQTAELLIKCYFSFGL